MDLELFYKHIGGNYQKVLIYLLSDTIIIKYINKFLNDNSFNLLQKSINENDYKAAFMACHTLKGICLNLDFGFLLNSSKLLVEELRDLSRTNIENINPYFAKVKEDYLYLIDNINKLIF